MTGEHPPHHASDALGVSLDLADVLPQDPAGDVARQCRAGCCLANQLPSSFNRCAQACGYSISGWSIGLIRIRSAMVCRRR